MTADTSALDALSPLDGRYAAKVAPLRAYWSEAAFMRHRVQVEVAWLIALSDAGLPELKPFSPAARLSSARTESNIFSIKKPSQKGAIEYL